MTNREAIIKIVNSISLAADRQVLLNQKPWGKKFEDPYMIQPNNRMLFETIQHLIYTVYYSRSSETDHEATNPDIAAIEAYNQLLSQYNRNQDRFDFGWQVEQIDMMGGIMAGKGNYKRTVYPGEFIHESAFHQKPAVGSEIKLIARKEFKGIDNGFYFTFGKTLAEDHASCLVRFYFNLSPVGAQKMVSLISDMFNFYEIPFSFKCLNHPSFYKRADAAVLYLDQRYADYAWLLVQGMLHKVKDNTNDEVPLFTKKLAPGVSFAENPINPEESFGTHISKMIAQGFMHCFQNQIDRLHWADEVISNIQNRHGYTDLEKMHINPGSHYPYLFTQKQFA